MVPAGMLDVDVGALLSRSLGSAMGAPATGPDAKAIHRARSSAVVEAIAAELRLAYAHRSDVVVFSKLHAANRETFGLNELLFDVTVCRVASIPATERGPELRHVVEPLWAIESELAKRRREAVYDFNKLVLARARNKLFIGPQVHDEDAFIACLGHVADACEASVHLALVPHPSEWAAGAPASARLWTRSPGVWERL